MVAHGVLKWRLYRAAKRRPAHAMNDTALPTEAATETALFAAGCFWGVQETLRTLPGVTHTAAGYTGGHLPQPDYKTVCGGNSGHAEAVQVLFNPQKISYEQLLQHFWQLHDPTQLNRQGPDIGAQYRSAIFYTNDRQKNAAESSKAQAQRRFAKPIVTEITAAAEFWPAEEYHQCYVQKRRDSGFF